MGEKIDLRIQRRIYSIKSDKLKNVFKIDIKIFTDKIYIILFGLRIENRIVKVKAVNFYRKAKNRFFFWL